MRLTSILKPEYFYQPKLGLKRLLRLQPSATSDFTSQKLPWGLSIRVRSEEEHGRILSRLGVIDLAVTEALWRLTDPGETAVDVGANIGYMTAVLAARLNAAPGGNVWAFEAHPEIFQELKYNVEQWLQRLNNVAIELQPIAISSNQGSVSLGIPEAFISNRGLATVLTEDPTSVPNSSNTLKTFVVQSASLDKHFPSPAQIGVLKIDVEGHELHVLQGATNLLQDQRVRDCIFEEHREYPTEVTHHFEELGYSVFRIQRRFFGPALLQPESKIARTQWLPTSFLATQQPDRAISRFQARGWKVLGRYRC